MRVPQTLPDIRKVHCHRCLKWTAATEAQDQSDTKPQTGSRMLVITQTLKALNLLLANTQSSLVVLQALTHIMSAERCEGGKATRQGWYRISLLPSPLLCTWERGQFRVTGDPDFVEHIPQLKYCIAEHDANGRAHMRSVDAFRVVLIIHNCHMQLQMSSGQRFIASCLSSWCQLNAK